MKESSHYLSDTIREFAQYYQIPFKTAVRSIQAGYCNHNKNIIVIPGWIEKFPYSYQIAYVLHEIAHALVGPGHLHDSVFRSQEQKMLEEWGLVPVYSRAYIRELRSKDSGEVLYKREKR